MSIRLDAICEAVDSRISFIASATLFVCPLACKIKAAEPATNGADEEARDQSRVHVEKRSRALNWTYWSLSKYQTYYVGEC